MAPAMGDLPSKHLGILVTWELQSVSSFEIIVWDFLAVWDRFCGRLRVLLVLLFLLKNTSTIKKERLFWSNNYRKTRGRRCWGGACLNMSKYQKPWFLWDIWECLWSQAHGQKVRVTAFLSSGRQKSMCKVVFDQLFFSKISVTTS